jgi:hypothetical protein
MYRQTVVSGVNGCKASEDQMQYHGCYVWGEEERE